AESTHVRQRKKRNQERRDPDQDEQADLDLAVGGSRRQGRQEIALVDPFLVHLRASRRWLERTPCYLHTASRTLSEPASASLSRKARTRLSSLVLNSSGVPTKRILPASSIAT